MAFNTGNQNLGGFYRQVYRRAAGMSGKKGKEGKKEGLMEARTRQ
jgi:hypothetical protein